MGGCCSTRTQNQLPSIDLNKSNIRLFYRFGAIIGQGAFGTVRLAYRETFNGEKSYAIKTINKSKLGDKQYQLKEEFAVLTQLDHPNIIRFYEMFEDELYIYFVMEHCTGGDLLSSILNEGPYPEFKVRNLMRKLFEACVYMHNQGVMHRDLKPENILFLNKNENSEIKIIDFGLSKKLKRRIDQIERARSKVGSPLYVAPEVLTGNYDFKCDDWSLGCIMYVMLCGEPPFYNDHIEQLLIDIQINEVKFNQAEWSKVSLSAQQLIKVLLIKDPVKRVSSEDALRSAFLMRKNLQLNMTKISHVGVSQDTPVNTNNIRALRSYADTKLLKRETLRILINQLNQKQLSKLTEKFKEIDVNNDGYITYVELAHVMNRLGLDNTKQEIENVLSKIPRKHESPMKIKYTEFLAAIIDQKIYTDRERLWSLFKYFDIENKSYITYEDVKLVLEREGRAEDLEQIQQEIQQNEGKIYFEDFCKVMNTDTQHEAVFQHFEQQYASPQKKP